MPSTVAVSDAGTNTVDIFNESGTLEATLTGFSEPQGMTSDRLGNIYIADTANGQIQIWAPPYSGPPTLLADPGQYPAGVDQRNNGGFIAVSNIISQQGTAGSISLYRNGSQVATVTDPNLQEVYFLAFDHTGNLYFSGLNTAFSVIVGEVAHASTGGRTVQYLTTSNAISFPGRNSGQQRRHHRRRRPERPKSDLHLQCSERRFARNSDLDDVAQQFGGCSDVCTEGAQPQPVHG